MINHKNPDPDTRTRVVASRDVWSCVVEYSLLHVYEDWWIAKGVTLYFLPLPSFFTPTFLSHHWRTHSGRGRCALIAASDVASAESWVSFSRSVRRTTRSTSRRKAASAGTRSERQPMRRLRIRQMWWHFLIQKTQAVHLPVHRRSTAEVLQSIQHCAVGLLVTKSEVIPVSFRSDPTSRRPARYSEGPLFWKSAIALNPNPEWLQGKRLSE